MIRRDWLPTKDDTSFISTMGGKKKVGNWQRLSISALEADIAYFDARLSMLEDKPPTPYYLAQKKTYEDIMGLLKENLEQLRGERKRRKLERKRAEQRAAKEKSPETLAEELDIPMIDLFELEDERIEGLDGALEQIDDAALGIIGDFDEEMERTALHEIEKTTVLPPEGGLLDGEGEDYGEELIERTSLIDDDGLGGGGHSEEDGMGTSLVDAADALLGDAEHDILQEMEQNQLVDTGMDNEILRDIDENILVEIDEERLAELDIDLELLDELDHHSDSKSKKDKG